MCYVVRLDEAHPVPDKVRACMQLAWPHVRQVCDNPHCGKAYHSLCLTEWLRSTSTVRQSFDTLFGASLLRMRPRVTPSRRVHVLHSTNYSACSAGVTVGCGAWHGRRQRDDSILVMRGLVVHHVGCGAEARAVVDDDRASNAGGNCCVM